ncbi:hypothetical protein XELAEV_18047687mg [Xenopus laevis]|uniref:Uncharacterized protein n=1 Tax=Xenopus laevis TaxID=8355 RepID=A0A974BVJ6_XENLA|nr:hypothetical protein XELAEV_18047687mg [Xenopus laevis]
MQEIIDWVNRPLLCPPIADFLLDLSTWKLLACADLYFSYMAFSVTYFTASSSVLVIEGHQLDQLEWNMELKH